MQKHIEVINAAENNLKNISVKIPHNLLTVITGVSGSGKSSLAYDVIYNESKRRYLESFDTFSKQYLGKLEKPKVEKINGLLASIAINQKSAIPNPRSTVGTLSDIYDYLRLLFARMGEVFCPECNSKIIDKKKCKNCSYEFPKIQSKLFSFNSKYGACEKCNGLGVVEKIDSEKLIADRNKSLREGALVPTTPTGYIVYSQVTVDSLNEVCKAHNFNVEIPWKDLTDEQQNVIMFGSERVKVLFGKHSLESRLKWKGITAKPREEGYYKGMVPIMEDILHRDRNDNILRFASSFICNKCNGSRLRYETQYIKLKGNSISAISEIQINALKEFITYLNDSETNNEIIESVISPILLRINYLELLGLGYLTLSRESGSLSGGESQRIKLASQIGSGLQGVLYILDEPSKGLHPSDNYKLIKLLKELRDNGNTVVVVEHDEDTIKSADFLIDIGPRAGIHGGELIYQGKIDQFFNDSILMNKSLTAAEYSKKDEVKYNYRLPSGGLKIFSANKFNLKNIDVEFKLGVINCVTGVSGAGKSTLVHQVLARSIKNKNSKSISNFKIETTDEVKRVIEVDQAPIGRTPRSNPATYTKLMDLIRDFFSSLPEAREKGFKKGYFSFNNAGGRCEDCQGAGKISIGLHYLSDIHKTCEKCGGKRFKDEILSIKFKGKNIYDILELSVNEAIEFFKDNQKILKILHFMQKLDIGYLKLGQPSTTLSGGEAQRVKLASELHKNSTGHTLYILDEPTVGLHKSDIKFLLKAIDEIVEKNNTVIIIEHDKEIIKNSDWVIDLGPGSGDNGGSLVFSGTPEDLLKCKSSITGSELLNSIEPDIKKDKNIVTESPIKFKGVNTHNLKNLELEIPLNKINVFTGVSGSGKSSLVFDTIYSECRNRFTEGFSTYARRMMKQLQKPDFEESYGLTPAIAIEQKKYAKNSRSIVATVTDLFDPIRLLFSRAGEKLDGLEKYSMSHFSFNKPEGACHSCEGFGHKISADPDKFISDSKLSFTKGAMDESKPGKFFGDKNGQYINTLMKVGQELKIDFTKPVNELTSKELDIALLGTGDKKYDVEWKYKRGQRAGIHKMNTEWKGFVNYLNEDYLIKKDSTRVEAFKNIMTEFKCEACRGKRYNPEVLEVKINHKNIADILNLSFFNAKNYFSEILTDLNFTPYEKIVTDILKRIDNFINIGLEYIQLGRLTSSLSGGEAQRIRLASNLNADLTGITYILDEPTVGLHSKDTDKLINLINKLKENGNTLLIVEHDKDIINIADNIFELGSGSGTAGGNITFFGSKEKLINSKEVLTSKYLFSDLNIRRRKNDLKKDLLIKSAFEHNLKNIDVKIPINGLVTITGLSGSGKSTLVFDVIAKSFELKKSIGCKEICGLDKFDSICKVDQSPISTSITSTVSTYTGIHSILQNIFSNLEISKINGLKKSFFSINSKDGTCAECKGIGKVKVSLDFISDVWVTCDSCNGKRFKQNVLDVKINEFNITDILNSKIEDLVNILGFEKKLKTIFEILCDAGLGYLELGQTTNTLSGGESQRLKLAKELITSHNENTLFLFDEPTTGLFFTDVERLLKLCDKLIKNGNSIIAIEHNIDFIKNSDWIIDLGPSSGENGGKIIYSGSYEKISEDSSIYGLT